MKRILIVEDDPAILRGLTDSLKQEHYEVFVAQDGQKGYEIGRRENIDLIILDIVLPKMNGQDVCRELRKAGIQTPILMLTSKKHELDKVLGLELGADDYMTKPFGIRELHARIKALLRRNVTIQKDIDVYSFDDITIDFKKHEAKKGNKKLNLSVREFQILKYIINHEGNVVSRSMLLNEVWGYNVFPTTRTVDNYILGLRKKLEHNSTRPKHILTIHTTGYKFVK